MMLKAAVSVSLLLLAASGLEAQQPVSPPECAPVHGSAAAAGRPVDGADRDGDGLADACELALAQAFAPVLVVRSGGCNWDGERARPGGGYRFAVRPVPGGALVAYLPAYFQDCGWSGAKCWLPWVSCAPHAGDSEFMAVELASGNAGWSAARVFLSAHCFGRSGASCRWYTGGELADFEWQEAAPVVWVAEGRQANYRSKAECDAGHHTLDTCDHHDARLRFPVESAAQNIGSARDPESGCVEGSALGTSRVHAQVRECFWDVTRRFTGWQANVPGVTGYWRYLGEVAGFALPPAGEAGPGARERSAAQLP